MADNTFTIVAIDGGAAAGKTSTARALSERFNLLHADSGSHYRALTADLLRRGIAPEDRPAVLAALPRLRLGTRVSGRTSLVEIDGRAVSGEEIRSPAVNAAVSHFAAIPELRASLLAYQREQAAVARAHGFRGLVMEGRDVGSVIFPRADLRFFLHADPSEKARRRAREGHHDAVAERDRIDSSRATAPLHCADGAISLDTTGLTLAQVIEQVAAPIAARLATA
jgi:cytidylate kinase